MKAGIYFTDTGGRMPFCYALSIPDVASCNLAESRFLRPPDIPFLFLSFSLSSSFSPRISDATRDKIFQRNRLAFLRKRGRRKIPRESHPPVFISSGTNVEIVCRWSMITRWCETSCFPERRIQIETRSFFIFLCNSSVEINEISAVGESVGKFRSLLI